MQTRQTCLGGWIYGGLFLLLAAPLAAAGDWNQWRGPGRNGVSPDRVDLLEQLPAEGLKPLWITEEKIRSGGEGGWSSPVVAAGRVYVFAQSPVPGWKAPEAEYPELKPEEREKRSKEELQAYDEKRQQEQRDINLKRPYREVTYCFDAETGKLVWKNDHESVFSSFPYSSTPVVDDGRLYILCAGRRARCIDAGDGSDIWEVKLPGELHQDHIDSSFAVVDGVAVVLADQLVALDVENGEVRWQVDAKHGGGRHASPAVWRHEGKQWIIANLSGKTHCIAPESGKIAWSVESQAENSTPVIVDDLLVTLGNSRKKGLRCFRITSEGAEPLWTFQGASDPGSSPVVLGDYVYVQGEKRLACVELATGKARWRTSLGSGNPRYTSLVASGGRLFYVFDGLLMFAANPEEFEPLIEATMGAEGQFVDLASGQGGGRSPLQCSSPALVEGKLFVRLNDGLACYDFAAPTTKVTMAPRER